jgi:hypothetical protein
MRRLLWIALLAAGCAHAIKEISDCGEKTAGEKRVECDVCLAQNKAQGWLGVYEYRPDEASGQRCVRVK